MTTAMSRRRVSCRELGMPDCDGWLWKKRKESSVFIAQKWQRFWFILKGPALYWYSSQQVGLSQCLSCPQFEDRYSLSVPIIIYLFLQDEKAEGFVKISSYNIESAGEHKRK